MIMHHQFQPNDRLHFRPSHCPKFRRIFLGNIIHLGRLLVVLSVYGGSDFGWTQEKVQDAFRPEVEAIFHTYCLKCHGQVDPQGNFNLAAIETEQQVDEAFETWEKATRLISEGKMPPEREPQPNRHEKLKLASWFHSRFVDNVVARPGPFEPRRLTAPEFRNTLRSLFGFELRTNVGLAEETLNETSLVMKLLPTDPRGPSGYRNDSRGNQMTTVAWDAYSQLADSVIDELLSTEKLEYLEGLAGPQPAGGMTIAGAETFFLRFMNRVYRREVDPLWVGAILDRIRQSDDVRAAFRFELKAVLMSPGFLYRGLLMDTGKEKQRRVDDFELAERLSYFIWADMPDEELMTIASQGRLCQNEVLRQQTDRMLRSPKAKSLAEDWAVQWLLLDEIDEVSTNVPLVTALKSQPIDFFHYLIQEDRPILEMIDSQTEFVNSYTEGYYAPDRKQLKRYQRPRGIEAEVVPNQRISLAETKGRGGVLTMPGVLMMNRGPIIRGTWVLERILGEYLPDPPENVGQVAPNKAGEKLTFRQRFEQHRAQPTCALCHDKIDPLGFALEAYDAKGAFILAGDYASQRLKKIAGARNPTPPTDAVDTSGLLPTGESFQDLDGLKEILITSQKEVVIRNVVTQMLSYALCRKIEYYDRPTINEITTRMAGSNATYKQLIQAIAMSLPFREATFAGEQP